MRIHSGFNGYDKWRKLNDSWEDIALYNRNNEYRASYEARMDGEREYRKDFKDRMRDTENYCKEMGRSYESILKYGV